MRKKIGYSTVLVVLTTGLVAGLHVINNGKIGFHPNLQSQLDGLTPKQMKVVFLDARAHAIYEEEQVISEIKKGDKCNLTKEQIESRFNDIQVMANEIKAAKPLIPNLPKYY